MSRPTMQQYSQLQKSRVNGLPNGQGVPPRQGFPPGAKGPMYTNGFGRAAQMEYWARFFRGDHYLEPGPANRLVLSLKSGISDEIDFALDRLIQVSARDPELLVLDDFPGLLQSLAEMIESFVALRENEVPQMLTFRTAASEFSHSLTRATQSALILRNLSIEKSNFYALSEYKATLIPLILRALKLGSKDGMGLVYDNGELDDDDITTELRLYLLEILEPISEGFQLTLPGVPLDFYEQINDASGVIVNDQVNTVNEELFPVLAQLTHSSNRSFVISSFRCLSNLAANDKSDVVFSLLAYEQFYSKRGDSAGREIPPHPIQRAIDLLPLQDHDLTLAVLEFIYKHISLPSNAVLFCRRPDLLNILRLVLSKLHVSAKKEILPVVLPMKGAESDEWYSTLKLDRGAPFIPSPDPLPVLTEQETREILALKETERTLKWMRTAFEFSPNAEITQVALWTAYKAQFDKKHLTAETPLLPAADVIKMSTEAFKKALPMVTDGESRRFIIKNMRVRDRSDVSKFFFCQWNDCENFLGYKSKAELFSHIQSAHVHTAHQIRVDGAEEVLKCAWLGCTYTVGGEMLEAHDKAAASLTPDERQQRLETVLLMHVKTHLPEYEPPVMYGTAEDTERQKRRLIQDRLPDPATFAVFVHERYHGLLDENGDPSGIGGLCCLITRTIAGVVKTALNNANAIGADNLVNKSHLNSFHGKSSTHIAIQALTEGERSIFEKFAEAAEGQISQDLSEAGTLMTQLDRVEYLPVLPNAANALLSVEPVLLKTTVEDHGLGKVLGGVLSVVTYCKEMQPLLDVLRGQKE